MGEKNDGIICATFSSHSCTEKEERADRDTSFNSFFQKKKGLSKEHPAPQPHVKQKTNIS